MDDRPTILVVDDDELVLSALEQMFMDAYEVHLASSGQKSLEMVAETAFETIVLDIKMARMDGFETARRIRKLNADVPIIFHTGYPGDYSEEQIDNDHRPFDFVTKAEESKRLERTVRNAVELYRLKTQKPLMVNLARERYNMIGKSAVMQEVFQRVEQVAFSNSKVMILGPTGSGKGMVARAIHRRSQRAEQRFAVLSTRHKQSDLVASELFGHKRGAFTGATEDRVGMFEYADGGTLFLDEVGDLDLVIQEKLLWVLENGEIRNIGSPETKKVDVRVICATHRNLEKMVENGSFREDLYYRLKGVSIFLPALSQRREDIPLMVDYFCENYCSNRGDGIRLFDPSAIDLLIEYDWPGNVRQLLETVQSLIDLSLSSYITREDVQDHLNYSGHVAEGNGSLADQVREFKRTTIIQALARHPGNASAAARELQVDPGNFHRMLRNLGIDLV